MGTLVKMHVKIPMKVMWGSPNRTRMLEGMAAVSLPSRRMKHWLLPSSSQTVLWLLVCTLTKLLATLLSGQLQQGNLLQLFPAVSMQPHLQDGTSVKTWQQLIQYLVSLEKGVCTDVLDFEGK